VGEKVTLGLDIQREIKFNINAIVELEKRFDQPLPAIFSKDRIGFGTMMGLVRIGLKHGGMKLTGTIEEQEEIVGALIQQHWIDQGRDLTELMKVVFKALNAAGLFGAPPEEEGKRSPTQDTGNS
jgi:hypothetical protein